MARQHPQKDWAGLKAAYRRGEGSIADLAPKFGIAVSTAEKRCAKERWRVERQQVSNRAATKAIEADVESLASMLIRHKAVARALIAKVLGTLDEVETVDPEGIAQVSAAAARAIAIERVAMGVPAAAPATVEPGSGSDELVVEAAQPQPAGP